MTVPDDAADNVIEREHPASDAEFAAVAVLATLAFETDTKGSALPPLWPMLLHFFSDFAPPTGTAAESLDASCHPPAHPCSALTDSPTSARRCFRYEESPFT
jgi:hypothetical protein